MFSITFKCKKNVVIYVIQSQKFVLKFNTHGDGSIHIVSK